MFWGLIIEPNKRYTQTVQRSFHISMAALDASSSDDTNVQVMLGLNEKNYLLCTLNRNSVLQTSLDLNFQEGNKIAFLHNGKGYVHLTGYFVPEDDLMDEYNEEEDEANDEEVPTLVKANSLKRKSESESDKKKLKKKKSELAALLNDTIESDENDDSFTLENSSDEDDDDDNELEEEEDDDDSDAEENSDEEDDGEDSDEMNLDESDEEEVEVKKPKKEKKKKAQLNGTASPDKKQKNKETPSKKGNNQDKQSRETVQQNNKKNENQQKKKEKNEKNDKKQNIEQTSNGNSPLKKIVEGGVLIEDLKVGNGPIAKPGKFVQVYYEGRLKSNGKQFDASKSGPGFKFRLGRKEVIQGWDVGVAGMKVGGRRRITCPPNMAYGTKGSPPVIPPNSTLVFEVELKNVN